MNKLTNEYPTLNDITVSATEKTIFLKACRGEAL